MAKESTPHILHKYVSIRRSGRVVRNVLTQSLISDIKQGRLKKDDEILTTNHEYGALDKTWKFICNKRWNYCSSRFWYNG